jgi:hypothetical protein
VHLNERIYFIKKIQNQYLIEIELYLPIYYRKTTNVVIKFSNVKFHYDQHYFNTSLIFLDASHYQKK